MSRAGFDGNAELGLSKRRRRLAGRVHDQGWTLKEAADTAEVKRQNRAEVGLPLSQRVMTDNGSAYISTTLAIACRTLPVRHLRTRPRRTQTNGMVEQFIRTLLGGWAYGRSTGVELLVSAAARAASRSTWPCLP